MLQVYLKPTNYCNVGCDFCYLPETVRAEKSRMSAGTLDAALELIRVLAKREGHDRVSIIYHGGEPLSLSSETLYTYSDAVREGLKGLQIMESIQTSLIPLRASHIDFLKDRCEGHVGSSIDFGGRTINGSSEKYIDLWLQKVSLARASGLNVAPIMVPTKQQVGDAETVYRWFKTNGFSNFNIERYNSYGAGENRPSNAEHSRFLADLFRISMDDLAATGNCVTNNTVGASIAGVLHGMPGERWGGTCQRDFLVINPDGALNTCPDRIEYEQDKWPRVQDGPDAFQGSSTRLNWIKVQHIDHVQNHCRTCEFRPWCKSGCPITDHQYHDGQGECAGYKGHLYGVKSFVSAEDGRRLASKYLAMSGITAFDRYEVGMEKLQ
jgi:radical SAM protein with 4Fe4S-binding SPASM domain